MVDDPNDAVTTLYVQPSCSHEEVPLVQPLERLPISFAVPVVEDHPPLVLDKPRHLVNRGHWIKPMIERVAGVYEIKGPGFELSR